MESVSPRPHWRVSLRGLLNQSRTLYTPLSLAFLVYIFVVDGAGIRARLAEVDAGLMVKVFLLVACGHGFLVLCSFFLFRSHHAGIGLGQVWHVHVDRLPARYLPGGIWQTVSRALDFAAYGLPRTIIVRVLTLEMVLSTGLAALLGAALLLLAGSTNSVFYLYSLGLIGLADLLVTPLVLGVKSKNRPTFGFGDYFAGIAAFAVVWLVYGIGFYLFLGAVLPGIDWPQAIGVYLVSWVAGFLAFFAPQGIGVFEVVSSYLLTGEVVAGVVAAMFGFRALTMASDLGVWFIYRLWLSMSGAPTVDRHHD